MSSYSRQQLEGWLKRIVVHSGTRVLDIGGSQKPIEGRLMNTPEFKDYHIMDLQSPHELKKKPDIVWDINNELGLTWAEEPYDVVFCLEVMEYVWNPMIALKNINQLLKQGGSLFMSTPFIYPVHNPSKQDYLRYTEAGIRKILTEAGFEIKDVEHRVMKYNTMWDAFVLGEGMKPSKEHETHDVVGHLISAVKL